MKDIAALDSRIDRIEELVTLSLLEQSALNMNVRDAVTGLDRFKNGIVVDTFSDHSRVMLATVSIVTRLTPRTQSMLHFTDQAELEETAQTFDERRGNGQTNRGDHHL